MTASYPVVDLQNDIQPFDLLCFRGGGPIADFIASLEQKLNRQSTFNHVGIVVNSELLPKLGLIPKRLYVLESTFSLSRFNPETDTPDFITKGQKFGVQIRDLEDLVRTYITDEKTKVAWAKLKNNPWSKKSKRKDLIKRFSRFYQQYKNKKYELNQIELFASVIPGLREPAECLNRLLEIISLGQYEGSTSFVFCAELVALIYIEIGVFPKSVIAKYMIPQDFIGGDIDGIPVVVEPPIYFIK